TVEEAGRLDPPRDGCQAQLRESVKVPGLPGQVVGAVVGEGSCPRRRGRFDLREVTWWRTLCQGRGSLLRQHRAGKQETKQRKKNSRRCGLAVHTLVVIIAQTFLPLEFLDAGRNEFVDERGEGQARRLAHPGVHAYLGKARHRVDLVKVDFVVILRQKEVDARQSANFGGAEGLDSQILHNCRYFFGNGSRHQKCRAIRVLVLCLVTVKVVSRAHLAGREGPRVQVPENSNL